jgi:long-subunit acyl-CoA synthetase (AMP-forming)
MGPIKPEEREACNMVGLDVYTFEEIYSRGESNHQQPIPPKPDDLAILMYTSGTTSRPKVTIFIFFFEIILFY